MSRVVAVDVDGVLVSFLDGFARAIADHHTYRDLPPLEGAVEALRILKDEGYEVHAAPFVPTRGWIRSGDEQFPDVSSSHTHEAHSLYDVVRYWVADTHHQLGA